MRRGHVVRVAGFAVAEQLQRVARLARAFEQGEAARLAEREAVARGIERSARLRRHQPQRVEAEQHAAAQGVDAADHRGIDEAGWISRSACANTLALDEQAVATVTHGPRRPVRLAHEIAQRMRRVHDRAQHALGELHRARRASSCRSRRPLRLRRCWRWRCPAPARRARRRGARAAAAIASSKPSCCSASQASRLLRQSQRASAAGSGDVFQAVDAADPGVQRRRAEIVAAQPAAARAQCVGLRRPPAAERGGGGVGTDRQWRHRAELRLRSIGVGGTRNSGGKLNGKRGIGTRHAGSGQEYSQRPGIAAVRALESRACPVAVPTDLRLSAMATCCTPGSSRRAACVLSAGLVYMGYFLYVLRVARQAPCRPERGDCVLLFGKHAPHGRIDRDFEARLDRAVSLWSEHRRRASCCSAAARMARTRSRSRAIRTARTRRRRGVPLQLEGQSRDTLQNLRNARELLRGGAIRLMGALPQGSCRPSRARCRGSRCSAIATTSPAARCSRASWASTASCARPNPACPGPAQPVAPGRGSRLRLLVRRGYALGAADRPPAHAGAGDLRP